MANLVQSDYDGATGHAQQIVKRKRTAGASNGKTMVDVEYMRFNDTLVIRYLYSDGTSEKLTFDPNVSAYAPGSADTAAHLGG